MRGYSGRAARGRHGNIRTGTSRPRRFEPFTVGEARRLLTTTQSHRLHTLFELALHTGLRKGELLGLRWEDLDLDAGTAAIRRTLQRTAAGGLTTLPTKTRVSERRIALPTRCLQSLKLHHEQQQRECEAAGTTWLHDGHVFTTVQDRPIDPTNLTRTFNTLLRMAGLRRIRFHDLRHSTATLLLEQGVELVVIKELLGHAHPHRRHRHRLRPRPAPPPARRHRHPQHRARRSCWLRADLRRRTVWSHCPPTLPSTTAVTPCRSPVRTHLTGLQLCSLEWRGKVDMPQRNDALSRMRGTGEAPPNRASPVPASVKKLLAFSPQQDLYL